MPAYRGVGSVDRRCSCRDPQGKTLGKNCPKLARSSHGQWFYRLELPENAEGQRRPRRRSGFDSQTAAQAELDRARELLALPEDGDAAALCAVGDLIAEALSQKRPLPEVATIRQLLRAGAAGLAHPTVGQWLVTWLGGKKNIVPNTYRSYDSHIRLYLDRYLGKLRLDKLRVEHVSDMFDMIVEYIDEIRAVRESGDPTRCEAVRYQRPVGATSKQRIRATLRTALNDAIRRELITFNAAKWVELPAGNRPPPLVWNPSGSADGRPPAWCPRRSWCGHPPSVLSSKIFEWFWLIAMGRSGRDVATGGRGRCHRRLRMPHPDVEAAEDDDGEDG
jgi:hypothetical protein